MHFANYLYNETTVYLYNFISKSSYRNSLQNLTVECTLYNVHLYIPATSKFYREYEMSSKFLKLKV